MLSLTEDTELLDEVVVVGYGTQKKVNLTGAVESVSGDRLAKQPVAQASQALVGLAPGLTAIQRADSREKIRRFCVFAVWARSVRLMIL